MISDWTTIDSMRMLINLKTIVFSIVLVLLLSSCGPNAGSNIWFKLAEPEERIAYYKKICYGYGYKYNTPNMTECIATEIRNKRVESYEGIAEIGRNLGKYGSSSGKRVTCQTYGTITNCREY